MSMNVVQFLQHREHGGKRRQCPEATSNVTEMVEERTSNLTENQSCQMSGLPRATFLMDFSPDGTKVASTHGDHTVRVTDISSGKCTHVLTGHPRTPWCVAFHPSSNQILASGCLGGEVRIWDLHGGGSEVWHSPTNGVIAGLAFHPIDHVLVFATGNTLYFWDWSQPEPFTCSRTNYEYERIRWVRFDPLGHHLYTGIANNTTVHREEPSNILHINDSNSPHPNRLQQFVNRRRYQQVIQRFHDYQQERLRTNGTRPDDDGNMEMEGPDLGLPPTPNPPPESSPLLGRHYSSPIESRLRRAGEYASSITETRRRAREIVSSISTRRQRTNPYRLSQLRRLNAMQSLGQQPGTWSPPPRVWPGPPEEEMDQEDMSSADPRATPPQLSGMADVGTPRPMLVRPNSSTRPRLFPVDFTQSDDSRHANSPLRSSFTSWLNSRRNLNGETSQAPSTASSHSVSYGANSRGGLRFEHMSRPVSGPNSVVSSPYVSSINRLRSRPASSAFREVPPSSSRQDSDNTTSTSSSSSSSTTPCAICQTYTPTNNNQPGYTPSTSTPTPSAPNPPPPAIVPTSSGLFIPRSQPSLASSSRLLNMMMSRQSRNESSHTSTPARSTTARSLSQPRTPTIDGASQTSGTLEQPQCSDQGTDVVGLTLRGQQSQGAEMSSMEEEESVVVADAGLELESVNEHESLAVEESLVDLGDSASNQSALPASIDNVLRDSDQNNNPSRQRLNAVTSDDSPRQLDLNSLTIRLERQVSELDRRITALRERFTERLQALHQDRERILNLQGRISSHSSPEGGEATPPVMSGPSCPHVPVITITRPRELGEFSHTPAAYNNTPAAPATAPSVAPSRSAPTSGSGQNTHLLEMFLRGDGQQSTVSQPPLPPPSLSSIRVTPSREEEEYHEDRSWHSLQQRHLHPHYSLSILDDTINRPSDALHAAINRAIAGAFMGTGEPAVASNIIPQTHRIQRWDFTKCQIPDISQSKANIVVPHCKLHNDASCDISQDAMFLATFVPSHRGFPDDNILAVFSLHPDSFAQCLYTKSFGPNAISVSLSPRNLCVMVGLAAKRLSWVFTSNQLVAQVYKLSKKNAGENSMKHVSDVFHPCDMDVRTHVSVNSARFMRGLGEGLVYGTNRGDLHICRHGVKKATMKASEEFPDTSSEGVAGRADAGQENTTIRMNLMSMLGMPSSHSRTSSIATQTLTRGIRRTAGTQTDSNSQDSEVEEEVEEEV